MIDFSNVKSITIPEGEVSIIARGSEILWQKQTKKLLRYIKFVVNSVRSVGGTQMQFSEIEFLNASGNRFNYPATTTVTSPDMPATATVEGQNKIIDGLTSTKFCTIKFASGKYLLIDLGEPALDVNDFCVWRWWTGNDNYGRDPMSFELWGSVDGSTYELLDSAVDADVPTARQVIAYTGTIDVKLPSDTRIPADYQEVEYIQSTGTQYIDTGIVGADGITTNVSVYRTATSTNECFCGAFDGTHRLWLIYTFGNSWYRGYNGAAGAMCASTPIEQWVTINVSTEDGTVTHNINGTKYTGRYSVGFSAVNNVYLFAMSTNNGASYYGRCRMAYCKLYDNETLVRDFVPCYRKSDGVAGMFDLVTETFFTNKGTGEFIYPTN